MLDSSSANRAVISAKCWSLGEPASVHGARLRFALLDLQLARELAATQAPPGCQTRTTAETGGEVLGSYSLVLVWAVCVAFSMKRSASSGRMNVSTASPARGEGAVPQLYRAAESL